MIARLEFELAYYEFAVQYINHDAQELPLTYIQQAGGFRRLKIGLEAFSGRDNLFGRPKSFIWI